MHVPVHAAAATLDRLTSCQLGQLRVAQAQSVFVRAAFEAMRPRAGVQGRRGDAFGMLVVAGHLHQEVLAGAGSRLLTGTQ